MAGDSPRIRIGDWGNNSPPAGRRQRARSTMPAKVLRAAGAQPYRLASPRIDCQGCELHEVRPDVLGTALIEVVAVESPIHLDEAARRLARSVGAKRVGNRILAATRDAALREAAAGHMALRGDFLWTPDMVEAPVRDRSALDGGLKSIDLIASEEISAAIAMVMDQCHIRAVDDLPVPTSRLLGLHRTGARVHEMVVAVANSMAPDRRLAPGDSTGGTVSQYASGGQRAASDAGDNSDCSDGHEARTVEALKSAGRAALARANTALANLKGYDLSGAQPLSGNDFESLHALAKSLELELACVVRLVDEIVTREMAASQEFD